MLASDGPQVIEPEHTAPYLESKLYIPFHCMPATAPAVKSVDIRSLSFLPSRVLLHARELSCLFQPNAENNNPVTTTCKNHSRMSDTYKKHVSLKRHHFKLLIS